MIKGIIFDLDGVIVDSEHINILATKNAFKNIGILLEKDDYNLIIGRHPLDYNIDFRKKYVFDLNYIFQEQKKEFSQLFPDKVNLFEPVINAVWGLKKKGFKIGLNTSSEKQEVNILLKKAKLQNCFDSIVCSNDVNLLKPNPESYLLSVKNLGLNSSECLAVEDSLSGLNAALSAKLKCILIKNKFNSDVDYKLMCGQKNLFRFIMSIINNDSEFNMIYKK